jgi:hypothetical protein
MYYFRIVCLLITDVTIIKIYLCLIEFPVFLDVTSCSLVDTDYWKFEMKLELI